MSRRIIAIDNGKMNMKARYKNQRVVYQNKYSLGYTTDENLLGEDTYNVSYKGKKYTIGANGLSSDKNEGKSSDIQIIQALTVITRFIRQNEKDDLYIVYGESVDLYFDTANKNIIKEKLEGKHSIVVNEKRYSFNIALVQVLPEGIGEILTNLEEYSGIQYIVDLGGATINFLKVVNGRPELEESSSFLLGVNNIASKVNRNAKRYLGTSDYSLIMQFIKDRSKCNNKDVEKIINEAIFQQFKTLDENLAPLDINIHSILKIQPVIFTGGTAKLLKKEINEYYNCNFQDNLVLDNALFSNVDGFYEYGLAKYGEE